MTYPHGGASQIWRDGDGVPHNPTKSQIRDWGAKVEGSIDNSKAFFSIKDYGAPMDGVQSDTPGINSAIAAAHAAGGGEVYAPPGGTVRLTPQGTNGSIGGTVNTTHFYMLNLKDVDNVSLRFDSDVVIDYGTSRSDAMYAEGATALTIHPFRYTVNGTGTTCDILQAANTERVFFNGSQCLGGTGEIEALVTSQTSSQHWFLWDHYLGSECDWSAGVAFYDFVEHIHISRNHFRGGTAFYPIDLEREASGSGQVYITENNIHDCRAAGIKAVALDGLIISNNRTSAMVLPDVSAGYNGEANGIEVLDCENYVIANNISVGNAAAGIRVKRGSNGLIAGNFTDGNTDGGVYFDPTTSGGTITDVTLAADNELRDGVTYTRHEKILNVKDMRPDANHRWFDVGHMIDFGGVENPLFGKVGTSWSREARAHPYGNTSLKYSPTGHAGFDRLSMTIPAEYWTPFKGSAVQITLNYEMADASYTGSARLRLTDGVNDYNVSLPVQTDPKDFTFTLEIDAAATAVDLTLYGTYATVPSHDVFFNHLTIGAATGHADQKKFASATPTIDLANGEIVIDPTATASPFAWVRSGGAWNVLT